MDNLGLAVYDAEGNLRPLNETFSDLNAIMAGGADGHYQRDF